MRKIRNTSAKDATNPSKQNAHSKRTTTPFMLRNPFKNTDWFLVMIISMLAGGAILFLMAMRLVANAI